jgi:membrane dipeptidase
VKRRPIIDAHLDLAWNALSWGRDQTLEVEEINRLEAAMADHRSRGRATTSLPELRRGGVAVCLATLLARANPEVRPQGGSTRLSLDYPSQSIAHAAACGQLAYYLLLERQGHLRMLRTAGELNAHWERWNAAGGRQQPAGYILAMEGADPIVEPSQAEFWWEEGLRSVNLAHYGKSRYAHGTGASGPLTSAGIELLRELERLGMILDMTHLCDESFFQALDAFSGPVLASHNNCRSLVPRERQFSDEQLRLLIARDAVIGAALDAWMLHPDWEIGRTSREIVALDAVADHIDHICQLAGSARHAAIGSDLDGGFGSEQTPAGLETLADLQKLEGILHARGYSEAEIDAIFHGNWLRFFRRHLPA